MNKKIIGGVLVLLGVFLGFSNITPLTGFAISSEAVGTVTLSQILGFLLIASGIILINADALRSARQGVPAGTFYAPDFYVKRDSNHGQGYHANLYRTKDDARTSIKICYDGSRIYVEEHGRGVPVSLDRAVDFIRSNAIEEVKVQLGRFNPRDLARPTKKARAIDIQGK